SEQIAPGVRLAPPFFGPRSRGGRGRARIEEAKERPCGTRNRVWKSQAQSEELRGVTAPPNRGFAPSIQHAIAIVAAPSLHSTDAACAMPTIKLTDTEVKGNTRIHRSPA
ncbi:hypothetical protein THAOC_25452, partial [Thalassiosira oceanica]